jgi:hypothetical protein
MNMNVIKRVLISVTDKKGIVDFARELAAFNVEILSTGGTAAQIRNSRKGRLRLYRLSGDDGRPSEDPASENPRGTPGFKR